MGETHSRIAVQLSTRPIIPIGIAPVKSKDCIDAGYPVRLYRRVNGIRGDLPQIRSIIRQAPPLPDPIVAADRNPSEWLNTWESQLALLSLASSDRCACPGPGVLKTMQGNTPLRGSQKRWIKLTANDAYIIGVGWALELPLAYSGCQNGPSPPNFCSVRKISKRYSLLHERISGPSRSRYIDPLKANAQLAKGMVDSAETGS